MIRIGQISYLNCTPIFTVLKEISSIDDYQFVQGVPSLLNGKLRAGEVDVCPSSSIEYARNSSMYRIFPELSISSIGGVKSVILLSRLPLEQLNNTHIGLTSHSEASVILLQIILKKFCQYKNSFSVTSVELENVFDEFPAVLMIGDQALKAYLSPPEGHYLYDLGTLWHHFTGSPFVFALWLLREELYQRSREDVLVLGKRLISAKLKSLSSLANIAESCKDCEGISRNALIDYWHTISYDLTDSHLNGVAKYFAYAVECGLLPFTPELRLAD